MQNNKLGKLSLLVRRNKGRTEHPYYATELSHALKTEVHSTDILDLEETDRLFTSSALEKKRALLSSSDTNFVKSMYRQTLALPSVGGKNGCGL